MRIDPPSLPDELTQELATKGDAGTASTLLSTYRTQMSIYRTQVSNLRSHLANERTHLSYLRTTVSLVGFGITINRFSLYLLQEQRVSAEGSRFLLRDAGNAGLGMVLLGLALLVWSIFRYWRVSQDIEAGRYHPRWRGSLIASIGLLVLGGLTTVWLFLV